MGGSNSRPRHYKYHALTDCANGALMSCDIWTADKGRGLWEAIRYRKRCQREEKIMENNDEREIIASPLLVLRSLDL